MKNKNDFEKLYNSSILSLNCRNLNFSYGNKQILNNIDFSLKQGEFVSLCGMNGSGKSTLLKLLSGIQKSRENIFISDENSLEIPIKDLKLTEKAKLISWMQQNEKTAWNQNVTDFILTGRFCWCGGNYSKSDKEKVLIWAEKLKMENLLERDVYSLSGGEFQKVKLARSLIQESKFLLLDEPASALDFVYESQFLELLKNLSETENIGILAANHNINGAIKFSHRLALLPPCEASSNPSLITGNMETVLTAENLSKTFRKEISTFLHPVHKILQIDF